MPMSEYLRRLRSHVGPSLLLVPSVTGLVYDDAGRVLLERPTGRYEMDRHELRLLFERGDAYPAIAAASASGQLDRILPMELFEHIGLVYHRLETIADAQFPDLPPLRLAVLLHEQSPDSLPGVLAAAGLSDFAPTVLAVIRGFGEVWKATIDHEIGDYVRAHGPHLSSLLLFELAHEGRPTRRMEYAAELGGLGSSFERWARRLLARTPPDHPPGAGQRRNRLGAV